MGRRMRRFSEVVRQKWRLGGGITNRAEAQAGFRPTSNERNEKMLQEAARFARYVRSVDQHLSRVGRDVAGFSTNVRTLLLAELPRHYTRGDSGEAIPTSPEAEQVGTGVDIDRIMTAAQVLELRMKEEVQSPLSEWLSAFERAKALMKKLENIRLELDSRRRTVVQLSAKVKVHQYQLENTRHVHVQEETAMAKQQALENKQKALVQRTESALSRKTQKRDATDAEFHETEAECMQVMHALLNDASNLRDFVAQSFKILHETSFEAYQGFAGAEPVHSPSPYPPANSGRPYPPPHSTGPYPAANSPAPYPAPYPAHGSGGAWNTKDMS